MTEPIPQGPTALREVADVHAIDRRDVRGTELAGPGGGLRDRGVHDLEPAPGFEHAPAHVLARGGRQGGGRFPAMGPRDPRGGDPLNDQARDHGSGGGGHQAQRGQRALQLKQVRVFLLRRSRPEPIEHG